MHPTIARRILVLVTVAGFASVLPPAIAQNPPQIPGLQQTFKGHEEAVYAVALSPDGKLLLTGSFDRTIRLWDVVTGKEIKTYGGPNGHQNQVLSVAFAPDGLTFASGGSDNTAKIWDIPQRAPLRETLFADAVTAVAISADGKLHAAGGKDGTIKLWNPTDAKLSFDLKGHTGEVTSLAFATNGQLLVSTGVDHTLRFWDTAKGQPIASQGAHAAAITSLVVSSSGNTGYTASADGTIKSWSLQPVADKTVPGHGDAITCIAPGEGNTVVTGCLDKVIRIVSTENGQITKTFPAPGPVTAIALAGNTIAAGTSTGELVLIQRDSGKVVYQTKAHNGAVSSVVVAIQTGQLMTSSTDGTVKLWSLAKADAKPITVPGKPQLAVISPDGKQLVVADADNSLRICQASDGKETRSLGKSTEAVQSVAISREFALIALAAGKTVRVINSADGKEVAMLTHPGNVHCLSFDAEKKRLVTGCDDRQARVWDLATGKLIQFVAYTGPVRSIAFHPVKPNQIIAGTTDKNFATNTLLHTRTYAVSDKPLTSLTMLPSGSLLAGGDDGLARIINVTNGQVERTFAGAKAAVTSVAVSRNGNQVATASQDKSVRLYQAADGVLIASFEPGVVRSLQFHPANPILAGANEDKTIAFWNIAFQPGNPLPTDFGKPSQALAHPGAVHAFVLNVEATQLLAGCADKNAKFWKVASDTPIRNLQHPNLVDAVAFNKDGSLLATGGHDGMVKIFETVKGAQVRSINAHTQPQASAVYAIVWSADGKQIASGSMDRSAKLWDATAGSMIREFKGFDEKTSPKGHREAVFAIALSPDGKTIMTASSDRSIKVWNTADGAVLREFVNPAIPQPEANTSTDPKQFPIPSQSPVAHPGWIYSIRLSANGTQLISAGSAPKNRGFIGIWNVADGKLLTSADLQTGPIYQMALTVDGNSAVLGCGPRVRMQPASDALLIKLPGR
jgi:WD40 repeat protein